MRRGREFATTSQWGKPFTTAYRRGRGSRRAYRSSLYNTTKFKPHYRSTFEGSGTITTGTSVETATYHLHRALFNPGSRGGGAPFFSVLGGAQPLDTGIGVPVFDGDIVLRGGIARVALFNRGPTACRVDIIGIWSNAHPKDIFSTDGTFPVEWDPSLFPEFNQFGTVISRKEMILNANGTILVSHKFRPQKLDQGKFIGTDGITGDVPSANTLFWMIKATPMDVVASDLVYVTSFSVSFCGDAITAT